MTDLATRIESHGIRLATNAIAGGALHFIRRLDIISAAACFYVAAALRKDTDHDE